MRSVAGGGASSRDRSVTPTADRAGGSLTSTASESSAGADGVPCMNACGVDLFFSLQLLLLLLLSFTVGIRAAKRVTAAAATLAPSADVGGGAEVSASRAAARVAGSGGATDVGPASVATLPAAPIGRLASFLTFVFPRRAAGEVVRGGGNGVEWRVGNTSQGTASGFLDLRDPGCLVQGGFRRRGRRTTALRLSEGGLSG